MRNKNPRHTYVSGELFKTETKNMAELGYGSKAFTLSLVSVPIYLLYELSILIVKRTNK